MAELPLVFRNTNEQSIATYDFYDLAVRTGYKTFYGMSVRVAGATAYVLTPNGTLKGYDWGGSAFYNGAGDLDFDLEFTKTIVVEGTLSVTSPLAHSTTSGAVLVVASDVTGIIYKVAVGGAETQIGTTATATLSRSCNAVTGSANVQMSFFCFSVDMPKTSFSPGEKLRLNITTSNPGAGRGIIIMHDPSNSGYFVKSNSTYPEESVPCSRLSLELPVRVDL